MKAVNEERWRERQRKDVEKNNGQNTGVYLFDVHEFVYENDHGFLLGLSDFHLRVVRHLIL